MVEKAMRLVKNTKKTDKRMAYIMRGSMSVLTAVLIVLFFGIMSMVSKIQGTARVVNYAGLVREKGYENTQIIEKSEHFFGVCDEATGLAEAYSQRKASALSTLEKIVVADIIGLVLLLAFELVKALRYAAQNRILQSKVYLDEATGLPNKNKCEEVLEQPVPGTDGPGLAVCSFDLNNLRTINNNCGHEKGDEYIRAFAQLLRKVVPESCFVGRNGGEEFLAVLRGMIGFLSGGGRQLFRCGGADRPGACHHGQLAEPVEKAAAVFSEGTSAERCAQAGHPVCV